MHTVENKLISLLRRLGKGGLLRSLRAKIILWVTLILVLVIGSFTYYDATTRIRFHLEKQEERAFDISAAVMKGIEYPMLDGEMEDVQAILQKVGLLEHLEVVKLCDPKGIIRYSSDPDNIGKVNESEITIDSLRNNVLVKGLELHRGKKVFFHAIPIPNEKACFKCHGSEEPYLGVFTVGINWGPIEERIASLRNREITLGGISLIIVAFFLIRWLSKHITHPILKVTEFAEEVSRGNLDVKLDLGEKVRCWEMEGCDKIECPAHGEPNVMCWYLDGTHRKGEPSGEFPEKLEGCRKCIVYQRNLGDEIVQLGDSLIHMVRKMGEMYEKISSFSKNLELQVAKRTEELEQKTTELEQANIELKKLDELRSTFLANMSHELRTPLNSIIGYTDLLLDRVDGHITDEQEKSLTKVHKNAKNLLKLINDVLDMSRIESGRVELDLRAVNLQEIIQETVSALEPLINNKGLIIDMDFDESLPLGYADPDRIRQVVTDLLDNAIKFTAEGRITVSARPSEIGTKGNQPPRFVEVCISDTGIGIRKEDLNKLFDKFRPLDISATSEYRGAGLGLSICKGLVEMQNGSIWAESKYGEGSRFCFALPVEAEAIEPKRKSLQQDYQVMGVLKEDKGVEKAVQIKVLVVDDEPDHVELISKILREEGYQITKAYDGEGAIESIKHSKPDLIILDLMMPNVSGFDVIEYLKTGDDTKEIPIIVVTGKELTREQMEVLNGRVEKILKKGLLGGEVILEVVRNTLDKFGLC
jgi:signal transduction histidine kinase/CheY-like chemotaxis protein